MIQKNMMENIEQQLKIVDLQNVIKHKAILRKFWESLNVFKTKK